MLPLLTKFRGELYQRGIKYTGMGKNAIFDRIGAACLNRVRHNLYTKEVGLQRRNFFDTCAHPVWHTASKIGDVFF